MRLSSILILLALLFISSVSAEDLLIAGTWSSPYTYRNDSQYCCIPNSIEITDCVDSNACIAYIKYPSSNQNCRNAFFGPDNSQTMIFMKDGEPTHARFVLADLNWNFVASESNGNYQLNIYAATEETETKVCDFTMTTRVAPSILSKSVVIFVIVLFVITAAFVGIKKYQSKQANAIIAQSLTQEPNSYASPNQFPNTQVNLEGNNA